jgi:hypothetical protein
MSARQLIAFLTGQSRPGCCALSPEQVWFLEQLAGEGRELVRVNFPYRGAAGAFRDVSLALASWRNGLGYLASRRTEFSRRHQAEVSALIAKAERVLFLAGSSGLELFNNLGLDEAEERKCRLICYGPVARRRARFAETVIVQGRRDWLSRAYFRREEPVLRCGHMGYLRDPGFLSLCREQLLLSPQSLQSCSSISA